MAFGAVVAKASLVNLRLRVARYARLRRTHEDLLGVARLALERTVLAGQREMGKVMIEVL